ncbi:MAG TPA: hypothetical protein VFS33_05895 [Gemmatimonadales bacterium]|nr:hypothetical protein [Gemmatimonadales bacterium]
MTSQPEPRWRPRALHVCRASLVAFALLALGGAPLAAQYTGGFGPPGGGAGGFGGALGGGNGRGRWGGGGRHGGAASLPTEQELAGPLSPEALKGVLSLADSQVDRYRPLWEQHMQATKVQRDSAQAALSGLHRALQDHDRTAMRQYVPVLRRLAPDLENRDKQFADKQLKPVLTKDQAKSFDKWRDDQKRAADDERRQYGRA